MPWSGHSASSNRDAGSGCYDSRTLLPKSMSPTRRQTPNLWKRIDLYPPAMKSDAHTRAAYPSLSGASYLLSFKALRHRLLKCIGIVELSAQVFIPQEPALHKPSQEQCKSSQDTRVST
eukprot:6218692-Amphidinium_carterae.1